MSFIKEIIISIPIIIILSILISQLVVVPTESMSSAINSGDMVLVEKTDVLGVIKELNPDDVKVGDIIIYKISNPALNGTEESGEAIIHRIIAVNEIDGKKSYVLKGDNNPVPDPENVYSDQIVGRAIIWGKNPIIIPKIGSILIWIKGNQTHT